MFEKLRYNGPTIAASSLFFGFIFYIGQQLQRGETMKGNRGFMRWIAEGLNWLGDTLGYQIAGYGIMGLALFAGVFVAVLIWRDDLI
jgi:hypothetical protein